MLCGIILVLPADLTESTAWHGRKDRYRDCLDVAIVGGGIGGTYTGWRLRERGLKIGIFERSNMIGGKLYSVFFPSVPNIPAQMGAMRFVPGSHTALESLLPQLGLESEVFQPDQFESMYYLRNTRLMADELESPKLPYNLSPGESRNVDQLFWNLSQRTLNVSEPDKIPDIEEATTPDGVPVYQQGLLSLLGNIWSSEAKEYINTMATFDTDLRENNNPVQFIAPDNPANPSKVKHTVVGGMHLVPEKLAEQFTLSSDSHLVHLNRRVDTIRRVWSRGRRIYELRIQETETAGGSTQDQQTKPFTVCAEKVVLALPPQALKHIHWSPFRSNRDMRVAFDSITDYSAMKIFLAYPNAWWENTTINKKSFVTDLPLRQGGEFGRYRDSSGRETALMMVSYNDGASGNDYWRRLQQLGNKLSSDAVPETLSVTSRVVEHVHNYLATMYDVNVSSLPWPLDGAMKIWDDPLNGRAWQTFKPGFKPKEISKYIRHPSPNDSVFIVTNAFSLYYNFWSEGCLREVDTLIKDFF